MQVNIHICISIFLRNTIKLTVPQVKFDSCWVKWLHTVFLTVIWFVTAFYSDCLFSIFHLFFSLILFSKLYKLYIWKPVLCSSCSARLRQEWVIICLNFVFKIVLYVERHTILDSLMWLNIQNKSPLKLKCGGSKEKTGINLYHVSPNTIQSFYISFSNVRKIQTHSYTFLFSTTLSLLWIASCPGSWNPFKWIMETKRTAAICCQDVLFWPIGKTIKFFQLKHQLTRYL